MFPFDRPLPPGEGDNQALAVNTTDGGTLYDVAFALVWADEDTVLNTNEAYALASCTGCQTVAVAFQVVLVLGQANVVVPQNLSAAVNYACVQCVTYALATQLVLTLSGSLDADRATAELAPLWREIEAFGRLDQGRAALGAAGTAERLRDADPGDRAHRPRVPPRQASVRRTTATTTAPASGPVPPRRPPAPTRRTALRPSRRPPATTTASAQEASATSEPPPATTPATETTTPSATATTEPPRLPSRQRPPTTLTGNLRAPTT